MSWLLGCALFSPPPAGQGWGEVVADSGGDADTDTDADTDADTDTDPAPDPLCVDAPVVTWESWGQGFLLEACQGCHASTAPDRYGAPTAVTFDTEADAYLWRERILDRSTGDDPTMPPAGGTTEADRYYLEVWLTCWIEADVAQ